MLMAVNIGNSRISVGFFEKEVCNMLFKFQISTDINKTADEYLALIRTIVNGSSLSDKKISGVILASVLPQLTSTVENCLRMFTGDQPMIVGPGVKTGFAIKIDSPSELGADMVANTVAALSSLKADGAKKAPVIIADVDTVTTLSAVNHLGEYVGCTIFPGMRISLDILHGETAQLPNVMLSAPIKAVGKNSQDAVRSGVILGTAMMLDGFVGRFAKEMHCDAEDIRLFMTGEYAKNVIDACRRRFELDESLTLRGLYYIYSNSLKK